MDTWFIVHPHRLTMITNVDNQCHFMRVNIWTNHGWSMCSQFVSTQTKSFCNLWQCFKYLYYAIFWYLYVLFDRWWWRGCIVSCHKVPINISFNKTIKFPWTAVPLSFLHDGGCAWYFRYHKWFHVTLSTPLLDCMALNNKHAHFYIDIWYTRIYDIKSNMP